MPIARPSMPRPGRSASRDGRRRAAGAMAGRFPTSCEPGIANPTEARVVGRSRVAHEWRCALACRLPACTGSYLPSSFLHRDLAACRRAITSGRSSASRPGLPALLGSWFVGHGLSPRWLPRTQDVRRWVPTGSCRPTLDLHRGGGPAVRPRTQSSRPAWGGPPGTGQPTVGATVIAELMIHSATCKPSASRTAPVEFRAAFLNQLRTSLRPSHRAPALGLAPGLLGRERRRAARCVSNRPWQRRD